MTLISRKPRRYDQSSPRGAGCPARHRSQSDPREVGTLRLVGAVRGWPLEPPARQLLEPLVAGKVSVVNQGPLFGCDNRSQHASSSLAACSVWKPLNRTLQQCRRKGEASRCQTLIFTKAFLHVSFQFGGTVPTQPVTCIRACPHHWLEGAVHKCYQQAHLL